jgi:hypothetical protein
MEDFFKNFLSEPTPSAPSPGGGQGAGNGGVPQPGMHPLMKTFSSKSFSNFRTSSLSDFPRTDSYAFLEVRGRIGLGETRVG